jgi:hypothetical protein
MKHAIDGVIERNRNVSHKTFELLNACPHHATRNVTAT